MSPVSRGFLGRRREESRSSRVPPGPSSVDDFPGAVGRTDAVYARGAVELLDRRRRSRARPRGRGRSFLHYRARTSRSTSTALRKWSKLDTKWVGVSVDKLLGRVKPVEFVTAWSDGGYTTNLTLDDVPMAEHGSSTASMANRWSPSMRPGSPARSPLYFWKSAKWVRGLTLTRSMSRGSGRASATTTMATHGWNSATRATDLASGAGRRARSTRTTV